MINKLIILSLFMILSACSVPSLFNSHYSVPCGNTCEVKKKECQLTCRNSCAQCRAFASQTTKRSYTQYQREEVIAGGTIARQLKSYRDPLQCRKTTCSCEADYQVCIQACGGKIKKQLRAAPVC